MKKFAIIFLLLTVCVLCLGCISVVAIDHAHGLDLKGLFSSVFNIMAELLCILSLMLLSKWMSHIKPGDQIIFSLSSFGWRNSNNEETRLSLNRLFPNLETAKGF
jgi:hypothetical protein